MTTPTPVVPPASVRPWGGLIALAGMGAILLLTVYLVSRYAVDF